MKTISTSELIKTVSGSQLEGDGFLGEGIYCSDNSTHSESIRAIFKSVAGSGMLRLVNPLINGSDRTVCLYRWLPNQLLWLVVLDGENHYQSL